MERYAGDCEPLCEVDIDGLLSWLAAIPLSEWPQQDRMSAEYPYPAMVSNLDWHDFGTRSWPLVARLMSHFPGRHYDHRMLSVVIPGQRIAEHDDVQAADWRARVHVPLVTNTAAVMTYGGRSFHLVAGTAYLVNTEVPHALANLGRSPRIHFFFDVREGASA